MINNNKIRHNHPYLHFKSNQNGTVTNYKKHQIGQKLMTQEGYMGAGIIAFSRREVKKDKENNNIKKKKIVI